MTKTLSISVALCTYNGEKYLREQLSSIAAQTRLPDEMVICDDGSADSTAEIIEEFARTAPFPVRCARNPQNLGSTKNFEKAISLCTGDLIALCDQDDIWLPEKLVRQAEMMERDPSLGGVFSDAELIDDSSRTLGRRLWVTSLFTRRKQRKFQAGMAAGVLLNRNVVTGATLMVRADLCPLFWPIPKSWYHDGWIAWMLVVHSKLALIKEPLIHYRIHASQQAGIENFGLAERPSLLERLKKDAHEEPDRYLKIAREMKQLHEHLARGCDANSRAVLYRLRQKIHFFEQRGSRTMGRLGRIRFILRNTANYHRYEIGWKSWLRDFVFVFV
jgi:glycosyltransferase involved in cell wall biosynthesis